MFVKLSNGWHGDLYLFSGKADAEFALLNIKTGEQIGDTSSRREVIEFVRKEFYSDNPDIVVKDLNETL